MENLCHTLLGAALARAGLERLSPLAMPVALVGANLPDVDVVVSLWGDLAYLEHHRGITHSVVGLAAQAPLLAGAAVALDRAVARRRPERPPASFWPLLLVAATALGSHTLLDFTNTYGVRPWLPFDATWYYADLVFIVDPWLWILLAGGLFLGGSLSRGRVALWSVLLGAMSLAVAAAGWLPSADAVGAVPVAIWFCLLAAVIAVRARGRPPSRAAIARGALVGVALYWGGLAIAHGFAVHAIAREAPVGAPANAVPTLMRLDRWRAVAPTSEHLYLGEVRLGREPVVRLSPLERRLDDPAVTAALSTCAGAVARDFKRFLYAEVRPEPGGASTVLLRDARFAIPNGPVGFGTVPVALDRSRAPLPDTRPCPKRASSW